MITLGLSYLQRNQAVLQTEEKDFFIWLDTMAVSSSHLPAQNLQVTRPSNKYVLKTHGSYSAFTMPTVTSCKSIPLGHIEYTSYPDTYVPYLPLLFHSQHSSYFSSMYIGFCLIFMAFSQRRASSQRRLEDPHREESVTCSGIWPQHLYTAWHIVSF